MTGSGSLSGKLRANTARCWEKSKGDRGSKQGLRLCVPGWQRVYREGKRQLGQGRTSIGTLP